MSGNGNDDDHTPEEDPGEEASNADRHLPEVKAFNRYINSERLRDEDTKE